MMNVLTVKSGIRRRDLGSSSKNLLPLNCQIISCSLTFAAEIKKAALKR
jgi:hypothetical protein